MAIPHHAVSTQPSASFTWPINRLVDGSVEQYDAVGVEAAIPDIL